MECNGKPKFDETTEALQRRLVDFRFKVIFKDDKEKYKDVKAVKQANRFYDSSEFKNKMKCAWFYVLSQFHKQHMNKDFVLKIPKEVEDRTKKYLEACGELNSWLNDHLQKVKDGNAVLPVKKLYNKLKDSDYWRDLPKKKRREFTFKYICETIQSHFLIGESYKERKRINGIDHRNVLMGYEFVEEKTNSNDDNEDEEEDEEGEVETEEEDEGQQEDNDDQEEQQQPSKEEQNNNSEEFINEESDSDDDDDDMFKPTSTF
jgi:hypothetical protein